MLENPRPSYIQLESQKLSETIPAIDNNRRILASDPAKAALASGKAHKIKRCILHAAPIAVTIWILVYNGRGVYWRDEGFDYQNPILQALQYLVKVHELLMGASLAEIALHRIHYDLCASDGLPLGLVTAAYQVSSITYLITPEFYEAWYLPLGIRALLSRLSLLTLLVVVYFLTAVLGPSSAVAMIPRLDWWDHNNPYPEGAERAFMRYKPLDLWPTSITKELIPPGCADMKSPDAEYCPYSGYEMVSDWIGAHQNQGQGPNLTIPNHGSVTRHLGSIYQGQKSEGWTISSTIGYKEAWDIGAFWQPIAHLSRPRIAPVFLDATQIKKPVVQVECAAQYSWDPQNIDLPHAFLQDPNVPWKVASSNFKSQPNFQNLFQNTTNTTQQHQGQVPTAFAWLNTSTIPNGPSLAALFAINTPNTSVALIPCSITAHWTPSSPYLDPTSDLVIQESTPNPLEHPSQWTPIPTISPAWAETMNPPLTDARGRKSEYIPHMMERYNNDSSSPVVFAEPGYGQESIPWRVSMALGLYLTEALARVQSSFWNGTVLCHVDDAHGGGEEEEESVYILGNLNARDPRWWPVGMRFSEYARREGWAEVGFQVRRYGYGWGFRGLPVKLAAGVLVLQALMGVVHVGVVVFGGWRVKAWGTMGEMLVLAVNSRPAGRLKGMGAGVRDERTWRAMVRIREMRERRVELVVDGGGLSDEMEVGVRLREGRRYL
ncbi:MAG: hypothetical protein Q9182_004729 [Xanthomendoza sp. 2 TL-2023]